MSLTSSETVTDDSAPVIAFVTRLHAAAKAGRQLLEAAEFEEENYGVGTELRVAMRAARAAYDRLAEVQVETA